MVMLTESHLQHLRRARDVDFSVRLAESLARQFSDAAKVPRETLVDGIGQQIDTARAYGLTTERQLYDYVVSAWMLGGNFDTRFPAAKRVLNADDYSPNEKTRWLKQWTRTIFKKLEND